MKKIFFILVTLLSAGYGALYAHFLLFVKPVRDKIPGAAGLMIPTILRNRKEAHYIQAPKRRD